MQPQPTSLPEIVVTTCFIGTWVVLGGGGFLLFYLSRDITFKRKWFPRYVILGGVLFVFFSTTLSVLSSGPRNGLIILMIVVPATALIAYLNIRFTKFCGKCGATLYHQNWFSRMKFCSRCGAELNPKQEASGDFLE